MTEERHSEDGIAVSGPAEPAAPSERIAPAAAPTETPARPATSPRDARLEELYTALLPKNRAQLVPAKAKELEDERFALLEEQMAAGKETPTAAPATPSTGELDAAGWLQVLGPPRGQSDGDYEGVPADATWNVAELNAARSALAQLGFPQRVLHDFIDAERQLPARDWSEEDGRAALAATHGAASAAKMIDDAQVMLEMLHEHAIGRQYVAKWEAAGAFNSPALIEALSRALDQQPRANDGWINLNLKRAARWAANRRGATA